MKTYRVVQWATGNIGSRALRAVIDHPAMTLAGVYVHSAAKAGRDAGDLCGVDPTGVLATNRVDDIIGVDADCVLYMPQGCNFGDVARLLESGKNVVTTAGGFHHPGGLDAAIRAQIEAACARGGTSVHATGSSPGFISEAVPFVLTSIQRRLDRLAISEFADLSKRDSPVLLFDLMGFGKDPASFDDRRWQHMVHSFGPSLTLVAEALSLPLDGIGVSGEVAVARREVHIAAGRVPAGTVAGQRFTVSGMRGGRPLLQHGATWYCTADLDPAWDVRATGWHVVVEGDAPLDIDMRLDVPLERMGELSPNFTANRAVNAVPFVCAAPPGITSTVDLPQVIAILS